MKISKRKRKKGLLERKKKKRVRSTKDKENETRFTLVMIGGGIKAGLFCVDNGLLFLLRCCCATIYNNQSLFTIIA